MKIALISPKGEFFSHNREFKEYFSASSGTVSYNQYWSGVSSGLLIIAALTPPHHEIEFIDDNIEPVDFKKNYDLVGISGVTQQAVRAFQIADEFRKRNVKVVMGGIHATLLPEEAALHADAVVIGEAEYLWPELLKDLEKKTLKQFYQSKKTVDLTDSVMPRYDLLKNKNYKTLWVQSTRGCPHDCEFCAASKVYGHKYRHKPVEQVIKEIRYLKDNFKNFRLCLSDDNLFVNKIFYFSFIEELSKLNIRWMAQTDISVAENEKLLQLLSQSGCYSLFIGLETLSEQGLKNLDKQGWKFKKLTKYAEYIQKIQSYGIGVYGAFILGLDTDTTSTFDELIQFIIDNHIYAAQITILTPFPGTRLRKRLENEKRILNTTWDNYTGFDVNFIPKNMTAEELQSGVLKIYKAVNSQEVFNSNMTYFKEIQKKLLLKSVPE
jgi:radical SAM superfamily enzyme YgiQ (UPF0313 family)